MRKAAKKLTLLCLVVIAYNLCFAQDTSKLDCLIELPTKLFSTLDKKTAAIENKVDKQTGKYLSKIQRRENKLRKKLYRRDSTLAGQLFDGANEKYDQLKTITVKSGKYSALYSGHLDSLTTALNFLKSENLSSNPELQKTLSQFNELQQKLNASDQIRKQLIQREQMLKEQFQKLGMVKLLKQYRKKVYYYQQQIKEYRQTFEDPSKLETKLIETVMKFPQFKDFFVKNSLLGSMFALPNANNVSNVSLAGLQTRAMVSQSLISRFGNSSAITQQLHQNIQSAQSQLEQLKNKLSSYKNGSYGNSSDGDIPGFRPNTQKTKSFLQRLEYGSNFQSQKSRYYFPVTSDIGLSLGYKLNDKSVIGIGASYKLGWGNSWNNIKISHQGIGLRSYLDYKIKGSFYLSGGYEQNYHALIKSIDQLKNYSAWQTSGLIGLTKKYSITKKMRGEMKLLWDFMSYHAVPTAQPILFRVGYSLK